ncbi:class I SAM-dependent methyltransferase [Spongiimicrobium sp. 2-473A-2-J]|uniref:class I SAM-dependent methyltransferase n=1 Tax=Eudoraea algarum TaxID=3417568 RepID=UPI003D35BAE1
MKKDKSKNTGNPVRGRINAWMFHLLDGYSHYLYSNRKRKLFGELPLTLVEIGPGAGANIRYLQQKSQLIAIEPNEYMYRRLQNKAEKYNIDLEIKPNMAERIDLESNSVEAVISTLTLCTIADNKKALNEIKRILKPGGKFFFLEHVGAKKGSLLRGIQKLVHRPWFWFFEGCHTHKDIAQGIGEAGFSEVHMEDFNMYSPFVPITPQISGYAVK